MKRAPPTVLLLGDELGGRERWRLMMRGRGWRKKRKKEKEEKKRETAASISLVQFPRIPPHLETVCLYPDVASIHALATRCFGLGGDGVERRKKR